MKTVSKDTGGSNADKDKTVAHLAMLSDSWQYQSMTRNIYKHMLDRQKKDLIALTMKINALQESLRSKTNIYDTESKLNM